MVSVRVDSAVKNDEVINIFCLFLYDIWMLCGVTGSTFDQNAKKSRVAVEAAFFYMGSF